MQPTELSDGVVLLSVPTKTDVDAITKACQDPQIQAWTTVPSPYARSDAEYFVSTLVAEGWASDSEYVWAVRVAGRFAGTIGLVLKPAGSAEVGFWLAPEARGKGLLRRALLLVLGWAFDHPAGPGLDRIGWQAYAGNWASWRAVWQVGFRFEGVSRLGAVQRGARRDNWVGSILRADQRQPVVPWPATGVVGPQPTQVTVSHGQAG